MASLFQLRVFIAVAESGGVRAAADKIGRTPSAISMTLKQLEAELGGSLFEGERKARLSRFGQFVHDEARSLVAHSDRVMRSVSAFSKNSAGNVEAALLPSIAVAFLPQTMRRMIAESPAIEVNVRDLDSRGIQEAVSREIIEVGIASYHPSSSVIYEALFSEPLSLVCRSDDPLCGLDRPLSWEDVADRTFISNNSYDALVMPNFISTVVPQRLHVPSTTSLLAVVQAGIGVTVLPTLSRLQGNDSLRFLPIADRNAKRTVYMLTHADRSLSPAAHHFATTMKSVIGEFGARRGLSNLVRT